MAPDPTLLAMVDEIRGGTLSTLERGGRPQSSLVGHAFDATFGTVRVPVSDSRAKTRDARVSHQVTRPDLSGGEGVAELGAVAADPHDAAADALVTHHRDVGGEHPDREEHRPAVVAGGRLLLSVRPDRVHGWAGS